MNEADPPHEFVLPETIGLIVLEDCCLLPGCFLPLYIFEQRYRQMLDHALQTSRMFCVGTLSNGEILPVSTAGLIRASKKQADGTSHVMLFGVSRIRFTDWLQEKPFRIAKIEALPTCKELPDTDFERLKMEMLDLLPPATPKSSDMILAMRNTLSQMKCPELACDLLGYHFMRCPDLIQQLLMEPSLEARYRMVIAELRRLKTQAGAAL